MGMNYYLTESPCPTCGRGDEELHIGKSSCGWHFSLHVIPERGLNSLADWKRLFRKKGVVIKNEDGTKVSKVEMLDQITNRKIKRCKATFPSAYYKSEQDMMEKNSAVKGLNNLWRHKFDGNHCVGHGEGTWDLITGEFS